MNKHTRAVLATLLGVCGVLPVTSATARASTASAWQTAPQTTASTSDQVHLRKEFGLRADSDAISRAATDPGRRDDVLGIPLSGSEAQQILTRDALAAPAERVAATGEAIAGYGGVWLDQAAGGILRVQVTHDTSKTERERLAGAVGNSPDTIVEVARSNRDLEAANDELTQRSLKDASMRSNLVEISVRPHDNSVHLVLLRNTPKAVADDLQNQYADRGVSISYADEKFTPQSRDITSGPLYGGQWTGNCTIGYSNTTGTDGLEYTITAGHCGSGDYYQGHQNQGTYLGFGHNNHYAFGGYLSSNCDCVAVGALHSGLTTSSVLVANNEPYTYTNTAASGNYLPGQRECVSGAAYADSHGGNILCGQMLGSGTIPYRDGRFLLLDAGITSNGGTLAGDSGGPYGNGGSFLGIHAANNPGLGESAFSKSTNFGVVGLTLHY